MAKLAPLKMIEVDPMAWRSICGPQREAYEDNTAAARPPTPRGFWVLLIAACSLGLCYSIFAG